MIAPFVGLLEGTCLGPRLIEAERHDEADARAFADAGVENLGEAVDASVESAGVERDDRWLSHEP